MRRGQVGLEYGPDPVEAGRLGGKVILECQLELNRLLKDLPGTFLKLQLSKVVCNRLSTPKAPAYIESGFRRLKGPEISDSKIGLF